MEYNIIVGKYKVGYLSSVEIHKSVDLLADTAIIEIPGAVYNQSLDIEGTINIGDKVIIKLGYSGVLETEFEGYLHRIDTDDDVLTLNCEDGLYLTRKSINPKVFKDVSIKEIAEYCIKSLGLTLNCTFNTGAYFQQFVIPQNTTAYNVLKKIQDDTSVNIYMKGSELNVHPVYIENFGHVVYDFSKNIETSDLKYRNAKDNPIEVIIEGVGLDGKKQTVTVGTIGGDKRKIIVNTPMSLEMMKEKGLNDLKHLSYDGYEGSITGWLIPFVDAGYSAEVRDAEYEYKNGTYYVVSVTTTFSENGGVRKVQLGRKLSNKGRYLIEK